MSPQQYVIDLMSKPEKIKELLDYAAINSGIPLPDFQIGESFVLGRPFGSSIDLMYKESDEDRFATINSSTVGSAIIINMTLPEQVYFLKKVGEKCEKKVRLGSLRATLDAAHSYNRRKYFSSYFSDVVQYTWVYTGEVIRKLPSGDLEVSRILDADFIDVPQPDIILKRAGYSLKTEIPNRRVIAKMTLSDPIQKIENTKKGKRFSWTGDFGEFVNAIPVESECRLSPARTELGRRRGSFWGIRFNDQGLAAVKTMWHTPERGGGTMQVVANDPLSRQFSDTFTREYHSGVIAGWTDSPVLDHQYM